MSDESNTVRSHLTLTDEGAETLLAAMGKPLPAKLAALVAERRAARPSDWDVDCMQLRGRVLSGEHAHWCVAWDFLPIDETCDGEWPCSCDVGRAASRLAALEAVAEAVRGLDFTHTESCSLKMTYRKQANSGKPWPCTCGMAALTAAMTSVR